MEPENTRKYHWKRRNNYKLPLLGFHVSFPGSKKIDKGNNGKFMEFATQLSQFNSHVSEKKHVVNTMVNPTYICKLGYIMPTSRVKTTTVIHL